VKTLQGKVQRLSTCSEALNGETSTTGIRAPNLLIENVYFIYCLTMASRVG